jgi:hypothetical protein
MSPPLESTVEAAARLDAQKRGGSTKTSKVAKGSVGITQVTGYLDKKRQENTKKSETTETLSKSSPSAAVANSNNQSATDKAWGKVSKGPMAQLGKDYVAEQISKNGNQIIKNVDKMVFDKVRAPLRSLQAVVFDSIAAALTAKNDLAMLMTQKLAKNIISEYDKKAKITAKLKEALQKLYNALVLLVAGSPFFTQYLAQLRKALILIFTSRNQLTSVRNNLDINETWLKTKFEWAQKNLTDAEFLMEPQGPEPDVKYTNPGPLNVLNNVGLVSKPQQLQVFITIPFLAQEVLAAAQGYFMSVLKINGMLFAFIHAMESFKKSGSRILINSSVSILDNNIAMLDRLIGKMAASLNGAPDAITHRQALRVTLSFSPTRLPCRVMRWLGSWS